MRTRLLLILSVLSSLVFSLAAHANSYPTVGSAALRSAVQQYLEQRIAPVKAQYQETRIEVGHIDSRLQLADCGAAMRFRLHGNELQPGRLMVKATCAGARPWSIYIPAHFRAYRNVLVATTSLARGHVISPGDVMPQLKEVSAIKSFYLHSEAQALNKTVSRSIRQGTVISQQLLKQAVLINKGQAVSIVADTGAISVKMQGTALASGSLGDHIKVRNLRSKRVVQGQIVGAGQVAVIM